MEDEVWFCLQECGERCCIGGDVDIRIKLSEIVECAFRTILADVGCCVEEIGRKIGQLNNGIIENHKRANAGENNILRDFTTQTAHSNQQDRTVTHSKKEIKKKEERKEEMDQRKNNRSIKRAE